MRMRGSVFSPKAIIMLAAAGNQTHAHVAAEEATATAFLIVSTLKHGSERGYAIPAFVLLVAQKKVKEFLVDVHRLLQIRLKEAKARAAHLYVEWVERVRLARRPTIFAVYKCIYGLSHSGWPFVSWLPYSTYGLYYYRGTVLSTRC